MEFDVTIEIPKGTRNSTRWTTRAGASGLIACCSPPPSTRLTTASSRTVSARTGDPLDALVLVQEPTFPGCLIRCRAIGMFRMRDEQGGDDKVLCVPAGDPRVDHLRDVHDLDEFHRLEIRHFFEVYKALEPGKSVEGARWVGRDEAEQEIRISWNRARDSGAAPPPEADSGDS